MKYAGAIDVNRVISAITSGVLATSNLHSKFMVISVPGSVAGRVVIDVYIPLTKSSSWFAKDVGSSYIKVSSLSKIGSACNALKCSPQ